MKLDHSTNGSNEDFPCPARRAARVTRWAILIVVSAALLAVGCGQPNQPPQDSGESQVLEIRLALQPNPANKAWEASNLFKQELEKRSQGQVKVLLYDSATLGDERQVIEACYLGVIEMVQFTSSKASSLDPAFNLLDMPFLFVDEEHHRRVLNGPIGQELLDGLRRYRLQGLAFYDCGFRNMFNSVGRAIRRPEDLAGLKVRVMTSPVMVDSINALGASATPLSASELFQALKTGVVDAAENNPQVFVSDKYYEAGAMNFSWTRHFSNQHVLVANRKWLDELAESHPHLERLIREVARDIIPEYNRRWKAAIDAALKVFEEKGVKSNQIEDVQPFIEKVAPVYEGFFRRYPQVDRTLVDRIRKEAAR